MSIWNNPDWKSDSPELDAEHKKLNQMLASMTAVIMKDSGLGLDTEAIDILVERMRLHFRLEEASAESVDTDSCAILREDHARLVTLLGQVRTSMIQGNRSEAQQQLKTFTTELQKHDAEIDIPLFRMMAKTKAALSNSAM